MRRRRLNAQGGKCVNQCFQAWTSRMDLREVRNSEPNYHQLACVGPTVDPRPFWSNFSTTETLPKLQEHGRMMAHAQVLATLGTDVASSSSSWSAPWSCFGKHLKQDVTSLLATGHCSFSEKENCKHQFRLKPMLTLLRSRTCLKGCYRICCMRT